VGIILVLAPLFNSSFLFALIFNTSKIKVQKNICTSRRERLTFKDQGFLKCFEKTRVFSSDGKMEIEKSKG